MLRHRMEELKSLLEGPEECLQALNDWHERVGNPMSGVMLSRQNEKWVLAVRDCEIPEQAWMPSQERYEEPSEAMHALGALLDRVERRRQGHEAWPSDAWWQQREREVKRLEDAGAHRDAVPKADSIMEFFGN